MKTSLKKLLALALSLITICSFAAIGFADFNTELCDGSVISFGSYPQSEVTDFSLKLSLATQQGDWISYNYFSGTGIRDNGNMAASDYMKYKDVYFKGEKYRGVKFSTYRPDYSGYPTLKTGEVSFQAENGYERNTTYWFKYEPLTWYVLNATEGLVVCKTIVDAQPYNNFIYKYDDELYGNENHTYYANNYAKSSIRQWLNDDFYNTAFTSAEKSQIATTELNNKAPNNPSSKYSAETTNDKIFLLSYTDISRSNFEQSAKTAVGSDYALIQGLCKGSTNSNEPITDNSYWLIRSPGNDEEGISYVNCNGVIGAYQNPGRGHLGVRPAFTVKANSEKPASVNIYNYTSALTVDYHSYVVLTADNLPIDCKVTWYVNGQLYSIGNTVILTNIENDSEVFFTADFGDGTILSSKAETVTVNNGLFAKIIAFFKNIFGKLPTYVDNVKQ